MRKKHDQEEAERDPQADAEGADEALSGAGGEGPQDAARDGDVEARLARAEEELRRKENDYLRARADLDNVRRRSARDSVEIGSRVRAETVLRFLEVLDDLDRALAEPGEAGSTLSAGVALIREKMVRLLRELSVEPIEAVGSPFDPLRHEALGGIPTSEAEPDTILTEVRKGYLIDGSVLRPSGVLVAFPAAERSDADGAR